ncbi:MAG: aminotransferase class I/II-fold pyridoxal phosphate-dependent enzyme [Myxococcales bacterium]|nr:aminotransferase class I/II-fold pyridoxal phosphate-dependent enzyme [Myxococcales bacterium]
MRDMVDRAMERIERFVETLPDQPMHAVTGGKKLARSLREPMPEVGAPYERLLRLLFGRVLPASLNTASPGFLAYVPGGGLFHAAVADLIADATNRYIGVWQAAPALVQLETNVIAWFSSMIGHPEGGGGLLTTGGSMAVLIAIITARRERLPPDFLRGVVYVSDEVHHSVTKAALLAGFWPERIRRIAVDERRRMDARALEDAISRDQREGLTPFFVVASGGTVNSGAVDDLHAIADVAARHALWLHVDAAYGGFFALTERGKAALTGIERADSVTLDPHKGLFLPYGTGCLLVRERAALQRAHATHAAYMPPMQQDDDLLDFCDMGPELSRDVRGLRVWLPLKMHGAAAFRAALDEKLDLARDAASTLRAMPDLEVLEPELSLFAWRWRPDGLTGEALDARNRRLLAGINARQRVMLTGTTLDGVFYLRTCVLNFRTHREHIDALIEDATSVIASLRDASDEAP